MPAEQAQAASKPRLLIPEANDANIPDGNDAQQPPIAFVAPQITQRFRSI